MIILLFSTYPPPSVAAMDVSADLTELGRTPIAVVCAGAKSILDIGLTLEFLVCSLMWQERMRKDTRNDCLRDFIDIPFIKENNKLFNITGALFFVNDTLTH